MPRNNLAIEKRGVRILDDYRCFFFSPMTAPADDQVAFEAGGGVIRRTCTPSSKGACTT